MNDRPFSHSKEEKAHLELKFAEFFIMRGDKIKTLRAYWDTGTLMRQLGLM